MKEINHISIKKYDWMTDEQHEMITRCIRKIEDLRDNVFKCAESRGVDIDKWYGSFDLGTMGEDWRIYRDGIYVKYKHSAETIEWKKLEEHIAIMAKDYNPNNIKPNPSEFYMWFLEDCHIVCERLEHKYEYYAECIVKMYSLNLKNEAYFLN